MEKFWILAFVMFIIGIFFKDMYSKLNQKKTEQYDYSGGYKPRWLFSMNEKTAFRKIKEVTDEMGLFLFVKVRLYDLIEPKENVPRKQGHVGKIQSKHVDFVICNEKLVARAVIELDDSSHDTPKRQERDVFVNTVLSNCGYKVIHTRYIEPDKLKNELQTIFKK